MIGVLKRADRVVIEVVVVVVVEDIAAVTLLLYWDRAGVEQMVLVFVLSAALEREISYKKRQFL